MANGKGYTDFEEKGTPRPHGTTNAGVFILEDTAPSMASSETARMAFIPKEVKVLGAEVYGTGVAVSIGWTGSINKPLSGNTDGIVKEVADADGLSTSAAASAGRKALTAAGTRKVFTDDVYATLTAGGAITGPVTLRLYCVNT